MFAGCMGCSMSVPRVPVQYVANVRLINEIVLEAGARWSIYLRRIGRWRCLVPGKVMNKNT